jgi:hypothetical protein
MMIREQMGDWQIFASDCVVRAHQLHRQLRFRQ